MAGQAMKRDFFVSYNSRDEGWAKWIGWILEQAGYTTIIQAWDFGSGGNFMLDMQRATLDCERTLGVLSPNALSAPFVQQEWAAALADDPTGQKRKLVPVRVSACKPEGLYRAILYIDLVGMGKDDARARLLEGLKPSQRPLAEPDFPGVLSASSSPPMPPPSITAPAYFPGQTVPVFLIAVDEDAAHVKELRKHLAVPIRNGELRLWHPMDAPLGSDAQTEVDAHFDEAQIILLMVSAELLANSKSWELIGRAMERSRRSQARVIPILVSAVNLAGVSFEGMTSLPRDRTPIAERSDRQQAWANVARELRAALSL